MTPDTILWKSGCVKRWHCNLDHRLRESGDTTGAHSQRMAMLLLMLHPLPSAHLISCVITHDSQEILTGDLPATAKKGAIGLVMAEYERQVSEHFALPVPSEKDKKWVDLCDKLDAVLWVKEHAPYLLVANEWLQEIDRVKGMASDLDVWEKVEGLLG